MTLSALALYAAVYFAAVATPGPGVAALVARVLGRGLRAIVPFVFGFVVGDLIWLTIAATGLSFVARTFLPLFFALKILGAAYLLYVAWGLVRTRGPLEATAGARDRDSGARRLSGSALADAEQPQGHRLLSFDHAARRRYAETDAGALRRARGVERLRADRDALGLCAGGASGAGVHAFEPSDELGAQDRGGRDGGRRGRHCRALRRSFIPRQCAFVNDCPKSMRRTETPRNIPYG